MNTRQIASFDRFQWLAIALGAALMLRLAWVIDDAFIYFRYADNLLFLGRGLVFNQGEWVEGYSSPLWMMLCTLLRATRLDWWWIVRLVGLASLVVFGLGMMRLARLQGPAESPRWNLPLWYALACYPVLCYFTSGLETVLVQLAALASALLVYEPERRRWQIVAGLFVVIRHELLVPWLLLAMWCGWRNRRVPWLMLGAGALPSLAWLIARIWMYADWLPNTFHLKDTREWEQGWRYLAQILHAQQARPWCVAAAALVVLLRLRGISIGVRERGVLLLIAAAAAIYPLRVGGDAMYYRALAYSFVLALCAFGGMAERGLMLLPTRARWPAGALLLIITLGSALGGRPPQLQQNPHRMARQPLEGRPPQIEGIYDAISHRLHPELIASGFALGARFEQRQAYARHRDQHPRGEHVAALRTGWCHEAWTRFDAYVLHDWALTDPFLARLELPWFSPGHRFGLDRYAEELLEIAANPAFGPTPTERLGVLLEQGIGPGWLLKHLEAAQLVDARRRNRHHFFENLRLAFRAAGRF